MQPSRFFARVVLLGDRPIAPGEEAFVQLVLEQPIAATAGDRFVVRDTSAQRTIGGGYLSRPASPARKRRTPERLAQLEALALDDRNASLAELLKRPPLYVDFSGFARDHALSVAEAERMAEQQGLVRVPSRDVILALSPASWSRLRDGLLATLKIFHAQNPDLPGLGMERLRLQSEPRLPAPGFLSLLQSLAKQRLIMLEGAWVRLAGPRGASSRRRMHGCGADPRAARRRRALPPAAGARYRRHEERSGTRGPAAAHAGRPPRQGGRSRRPIIFFLRDTVAEMVEVVVDLGGPSPTNELTAAQFRDRLDNGRKVGDPDPGISLTAMASRCAVAILGG